MEDFEKWIRYVFYAEVPKERQTENLQIIKVDEESMVADIENYHLAEILSETYYPKTGMEISLFDITKYMDSSLIFEIHKSYVCYCAIGKEKQVYIVNVMLNLIFAPSKKKGRFWAMRDALLKSAGYREIPESDLTNENRSEETGFNSEDVESP